MITIILYKLVMSSYSTINKQVIGSSIDWFNEPEFAIYYQHRDSLNAINLIHSWPESLAIWDMSEYIDKWNPSKIYHGWEISTRSKYRRFPEFAMYYYHVDSLNAINLIIYVLSRLQYGIWVSWLTMIKSVTKIYILFKYMTKARNIKSLLFLIKITMYRCSLLSLIATSLWGSADRR